MATVPGIDLAASETLAGLELLVRRAARWRSRTCCWSGTGATCSPPTPATTPARTRPGAGHRGRTGWSPWAGEGTPRVREVAQGELGIARGVHGLSARAVAADVLDLVHRLPRVWAVFLTGRADAWLVRKIAVMATAPGIDLDASDDARGVGGAGPAPAGGGDRRPAVGRALVRPAVHRPA